MSDAVADVGVSGESAAPAAPAVMPAENAIPAPAVQTPAAASSPPPASPTAAPEVPPIETPQPEIPEPSPTPPPAPAPEVPQPAPPPPAPAPTPTASISSYLSRALDKIQFRKRAKLDKILRLAAKKKSIKNDDVEKLLRVSDATASRYLAQLVKEGRLRRVGAQKQPTYEPV
jgi:hypothetical protein